MIMLIIVSLLAVTSMRNASSSESVSGNVRTTELATQAADIVDTAKSAGSFKTLVTAIEAAK